MSMSVIKFTKTIEIRPEVVFDLLVCAFEGGSNYWYDDLEPLKRDSTKSSASECFYEDLMTHGFKLSDKETGKKYKITPTKLRKGVIAFSEQEPKHFSDAMEECTDATTGDVFLQIVVFGDVIYG
jgi:hypothetical protein